jgi:hypothetical protein
VYLREVSMKRITLALCVGALVALAFPAATLASHARPKGASPSTFRLVPLFETCTSSPNGNHGSPLALPSCNPPVQASPYLTLNASDRPAPFNTTEAATGSIILKVTCVNMVNPPVENGDTPPCQANPGDQQDLTITIALNDIRCVGAGGQGNCAGGAGSLYSGKVLGSSFLRFSDHYNSFSPNPPGPDCSDTTSCAGTAVDFPMDMGAQCTNGACNYVTSADTWVVNSIQEKKRAVVAMSDVTVLDAGLNGNLVPAPPPTTGICPPACAEDDPASTFLSQGLYAP